MAILEQFENVEQLFENIKKKTELAKKLLGVSFDKAYEKCEVFDYEVLERFFEKKDIKNDPMRIDTVEVGVLDLTNCVYGLDKVGVKIELKSSFGSKAADYKKYSGTFLIDCIILEPVKE